jgi:hypothetical protein
VTSPIVIKVQMPLSFIFSSHIYLDLVVIFVYTVSYYVATSTAHEAPGGSTAQQGTV